MIQILNNNTHLKIIIDGVVRNTPKDDIALSVVSDTFFLTERGKTIIDTGDSATDINIPVNVNPENLREIIEGYLNDQRIGILQVDNSSLDAFGRQRISEPFTIFDSKQLHDKQPLFWDEETIGTGTSVFNEPNSRTRLSVSVNNDVVIHQTKRRFNYQPGKSQSIVMTGVLNPSSGITCRMGIFTGSITTPFNVNQGMYIESVGTIINLVINKGGITDSISRANWDDPMDGTGASGINIDFSKVQIFFIDFQWLGTGRVRMGFEINGFPVVAHSFLHANILSNIYVQSPNLPLRYEIRSTGGTGSMDHICSSVTSEGGLQETGTDRSIDLGIAFNSVGTTMESLIAIRLKDTHLDISVSIAKINLLVASNNNMRWFLDLNPALGGVALVWSDISNNSLQFSITQGATIAANNIVIDSGYLSREASEPIRIESALKLGSQIDGTRDVLILGAQSQTGNVNTLGSMTIKELI